MRPPLFRAIVINYKCEKPYRVFVPVILNEDEDLIALSHPTLQRDMKNFVFLSHPLLQTLLKNLPV